MYGTWTKKEYCNVEKLAYCIDTVIDVEKCKMLKKYLKQKKFQIKNRGEFSTQINYSKKDFGNGNFYTVLGTGLQYFPKNIRNFVCNEYYKDCDIVNSHPTILKSMFDEHNIECKEVTEYVKERAFCLNEYSFEKDDFHRMMNKLSFKSDNKFLTAVHTCIYEKLVPKLKNENPDLWKDFLKLRSNKVKNNREGCFVATIYNRKQGTIIQELTRQLQIKGHTIGTLICDGFLIEHDISGDIKKIESDIEEAALDVGRLLGIPFKLILKPMKTDIVLEEIGDTTGEYQRQKLEKENEGLYLVKLPTPVFYWKNSPHNLHEITLQLNNDGFGEFNTEGKWTPFTKLWLADQDKLMYSKIDFLPHPLVCPPDVLNKWEGYDLANEVPSTSEGSTTAREGSTTAREGSTIEVFKEFLIHLVSEIDDNDKLVYLEKNLEYMVSWVAQLIQFPGIKPGVAICISGDEGTGKGTFSTLIRGLIGNKYWAQISNPEHALGRFNDILENKLFVVFDEAISKSMIQSAGKLRSHISENTIAIEGKGRKMRVVRNNSRFAITTNENTPVKIGSNGERRYILLNPKIMDQGLIERFYSEDFCYKELFDYLMNYDISVKNWSKERPITQKYQEIKDVFVGSEIRFIKQFIGYKDLGDVVSKGEFYELYKIYMSDNFSTKFLLNKIAFGRSISKIDGIGYYGNNNHSRKFNKPLIKQFILTKYGDVEF